MSYGDYCNRLFCSCVLSILELTGSEATGDLALLFWCLPPSRLRAASYFSFYNWIIPCVNHARTCVSSLSLLMMSFFALSLAGIRTSRIFREKADCKKCILSRARSLSLALISYAHVTRAKRDQGENREGHLGKQSTQHNNKAQGF